MRRWSRFLVAAGMAVLAAGVVPSTFDATQPRSYAATSSSPPNYQGLWWNSPPESESGWGINLAHQGDKIFATWFTYDSAGKGWWVSMTASLTTAGTYTGDLIETAGPFFASNPFDPTRVTRTTVGTGTLTFRDIDTGTLSYTLKGVVQTKYITRQAFGPLPTCTYSAQPAFASATNYQDLWWVAGGAESGWGINLTHQGDTIFATWFTYDLDGTPLWLSMTAPKTGAGIYSGQLIRTTGPAFSAQPFEPGKVTRTVVGSATLAFSNGNAGTFSYTVNGISGSKTITRQLFAAPAGTLCGAPTRSLTTTTAVAAGDIGQCFGGPAAGSGAAKTAALVTPQDTLVLTAGDHTYDFGTPEEFTNCFDPTWGAFKSRIHPTIGNHEYYTVGADGYFGYFGAQAGPDRLGYYSFDYGGWHFISLNAVLADTEPQSPQAQWLATDLAQSKDALCTIALIHYPAFNSGAQYGSVMSMRPVFDMLYSAGVEILLSGHEHLYERFAPQRANGTVDLARGVRQFVVGTGGHELNPFGPVLPNSEFHYNANWGVLRLTLNQGSYGWQFVPVGGGPAVDSGTASCHP